VLAAWVRGDGSECDIIEDIAKRVEDETAAAAATTTTTSRPTDELVCAVPNANLVLLHSIADVLACI
jgi:hypothetical protein